MIRRAISFITVLALCLSLCPVRALADIEVDKVYTLPRDMTDTVTYDVAKALLFDTNGYSYTISGTTAVSVKSTGRLYLTHGRIESTGGAGIEVQSGGSLYVDQLGMTVIGTTYGLDFASGATAKLSGGTFTGGIAAIRAADGDYAALLVSGCAYFDKDGTPISLFNADGSQTTAAAAGAKTVVVQACENHEYAYKANDGEPTHNGTCIYCGAAIGPLPCTFVFDNGNRAGCAADCGHTLDITIDPDAAIYDGTDKPANDPVTVMLDGNTALIVNSDYTVDRPTRVDVGETLITVTGITYNGTYKKAFSVTQAQPEIEWAETSKAVDYDGSPVDESDLPGVNITNIVAADLAGFPQLFYEYRKKGDTSFIGGLPTDAGTYEIKACLPEQNNYKATETAQYLELTIIKISALKTAPEAKALEYNGTAQELVTPGTLDPRAVGAVIQFAASAAGPWSTDIPKGTNAGSYEVWYKVDGTDNYDGVVPTQINGVQIQRKPITPEVRLSYYTCIYDGGYKQPAVTVIDPKDGTVLPDSEYQVDYANNQNVGTADVKVTDKANGNYAISAVTVNFDITAADQAALTITNIPNTVTYGDVFTLAAAGGSGNGTITWKITAVKDGSGADVANDKFDEIATIDPASGQVTVKGVGTVTVQATKSGTDNDGNHKDATAEWTFTAGKRSVAATVTAENKTYDGNNTATVHAVVEQSTAFDDKIEIELSGTFNDVNAGTNKTVTVNTSGAVIKVNGIPITNTSGEKNEKYTVTFSGTSVTADINKAGVTVTAPASKAPIYSGEPQALVTAATTSPIDTTLTASLTVEYSLYADGPWNIAIPQATDAGSYEVWYRVKESDNYLGTAAEKVVVTIQPKTVSNPTVTLDQNSYVYDGSEKKPAVTVKDGGITIPASEYTVTYSNNVNAGAATVTVTDNAGGNYVVSGTATFTITPGSAKLTGSPQAKNLTYNGQAQDLVTVGTASGGSLEYSLTETGSYSDTIPQGTDAGTYTVYYKVKGDGNHDGISTASVVYVTIQPKTVSSPIITLTEKNFVYDGQSKTFQSNEITVQDGTDTIPSAEYTVSYSDNVDAGTATIRIIDNNGGNYTVNGSKTFTIAKAKASFTTAPAANTLTYNGSAQPLVTPGQPVGGTAVYSLNGGAYSAEIPTGIASGEYKVSAKVLGDRNHEDSDVVGPITVTIGKKTVTDPDIELSSAKFRYNGSEQKPTVTVKDEKGNVIPENEYIVTYEGSTVNVGDYTVKITSRNNNYSFTFTDTTKSTFKVTIVAADQETLTITGKPSVVHYGDTIQLSTTGGSGNGTVTWSIESGQGLIKAGGSDGQFEITGVGDITIKTVRTPAAGSGYAPAEDTWTFHAYPKPVTAAVTAASKVYDGNTNAALTITVPGTDLKVTGVTGAFDNANVGTDKTVTISVDSNGAAVTGTGSDKYTVSFPATATASITPATPTVSGVTKKTGSGSANLEYTGGPQELVTAGTVNGVSSESGATVGYLVYSLDGTNYGLSVPTGTGAGTYTVWYKVMASGNYRDSAPVLLEVTIDPKTVTADDLDITCSPATFPYDGTQKTPNIIVKYAGTEILANEYTVAFEKPSRTATGSYSFTITAKPGGNYKFTGSEVTGTFEIVEAAQAPLSIVVSGSLTVSYGDTFRLSTVGGSGTGTVTWKIENAGTSVAEISVDGVVTVKGTGTFTVTAQKEGTPGSYNVSNTDSVTFTAKPKQITPVITVKDKDYDGTTNATLDVAWNLVGSDSITVTITGNFVTADVGTNKQVTITMVPSGVVGNYEIVPPTAVTGSIYKVDAKLATVPQPQTNLVYNGQTQTLLSAGTTVNGIGKVEYSLSEKGSYSTVIPTGTNGGTYTVWYRVAESVNWTGIGPVSAEVTIGKATPTISTHPTADPIEPGHPLNESELTGGSASFGGANVPGTFAWKNGETEYEEGKSYEVIFTPDDQINYESVTIAIQIGVDTAGTPDSGTSPGTGGTNAPPTAEPNTESASIQTSVRDGAASTVVNDVAGKELVDRALAEQSDTVVIKPEITGDVSKTEVSIPSSAMSRLSSETDAALTVSTPVADVTIPNGALEMLSDAGDTVSIVTERVDNTVVLTLTADGKELGNVPGGLTLTVPVEDAGPGTVAVLVHEDGTRETIRRSVAKNGGVRIPLNGSATVEIVDNSKEFADVPENSWAADAVAFASAHELFNGTGKTTFSPEMTMSRAMLVTVLYNLEGRPEQSLTDKFSDVDSDTWYAAGVSWAAANGITNGIGNGRFAPNDDLTREQLAVMLWRYVGKFAANEQVLHFTDADQASGYAMEALYWAAGNKILNGYGNGQLDPGGVATRAQAAQMLKNFIENT